MMMTEVFCWATAAPDYHLALKPDYQKVFEFLIFFGWCREANTRVSQPCKTAIKPLRYFLTHGKALAGRGGARKWSSHDESLGDNRSNSANQNNRTKATNQSQPHSVIPPSKKHPTDDN
jgi:hypothetical protein